jgi:tetratricopeptide (TPR) repeat protein
MAQVLFDEMCEEAKRAFIDGNYLVAEPILNQLILRNTRNPEVFQMLATIYYDKGQFNKAIKTFRRALEIDPTYTDASVGLSIILNDLGRYDEGKKVFEDAKELLDKRKGQSDPWLEEKLASKHEEIADLYFQYQRYQEALEQLLRALKLSARKAELQMRIAECFVKLGDGDKAVRELKNLIKDYPQYLPARIKLGLVFYNMSLVAEATEQWENVLYRDPHHGEAKKYLKMAQTAGITHIGP